MIVPKALFSISNLQPLQARTVELLSQAFLLLALTISIRNRNRLGTITLALALLRYSDCTLVQGSVTEN